MPLPPRRRAEGIGVRDVLAETDIPHPACLYPNSEEYFKRVPTGPSPAGFSTEGACS